MRFGAALIGVAVCGWLGSAQAQASSTPMDGRSPGADRPSPRTDSPSPRTDSRLEPIHEQARARTTGFTLVVPFSRGGPTDKIATPLAAELALALGEPVELRYVAGAGGTLAPFTMLTERATSGRTLLIHHIGMATAPTLYRKLRYRPAIDFVPIGRVADAPMVLLGRNGLVPGGTNPFAFIRARQSALVIGYAGAGSASQMCSLLLEATLGVRLMWIPYPGTGPAMTDLAAGRVDLLCDQTTQALPVLALGQAGAFAVMLDERLALRPDIPTAREQGAGDIRLGIWHGLYAPRGSDPARVARVSRALRQSVASPSFVAAMSRVGAVPATAAQATPDALGALLDEETRRWGPLIRSAAHYAD